MTEFYNGATVVACLFIGIAGLVAISRGVSVLPETKELEEGCADSSRRLAIGVGECLIGIVLAGSALAMALIASIHLA